MLVYFCKRNLEHQFANKFSIAEIVFIVYVPVYTHIIYIYLGMSYIPLQVMLFNSRLAMGNIKMATRQL